MKVLNEDRYVPYPKPITPAYFVGQTKEKLEICRNSLWHAKMDAEVETMSPTFNHKFDGLSEKLEEAYILVDKAYRIVLK